MPHTHRHTPWRRHLTGLIGVASFAVNAPAQVVTLVTFEGDTVAGHTVKSIASVRTNSAGGYIALLEMTDGVQAFWGRATTTAPAAVACDTSPALTRYRMRFDPSCGFSNAGDVANSVLLDRGDCEQPRRSHGFSDSIWMNASAILAIEDHPVVLGGNISWGVFSKVGLVQSGKPWCVASRYINTLYGSSTEGDRGLFVLNDPVDERIVPGVHPVNMAAGHKVLSVQTGEVSPSGSFGIAVVDMAPVTGPPYSAVVMQSGSQDQGYYIARPPMGSGALRTDSIAGPAFSESPPAKWRAFRNVGVLDGADSPDIYWVHGFTTSSADHDELVALSVRGFVVAYREGDVIEGLQLRGPLEHLAVTRGYTAMVWSASSASQAARETLFLDRHKVIAVGDEVPIAFSPGGTGQLTNFTGLNTIAVSEAWPANAPPGQPRYASIYFIGNVEVQANSSPATEDERVQGLFRVDVPVAGIAAQCPADFDASGMLGVQDIFLFLNSWFASEARADFNGDGVLGIQDIFDFLNAWFAGC